MRQKFLNFIALKGFSKATIRTYLSLFDIIISDDENIFNKSEDEIISYLAKKIQVNDYSDSYVAQYVSVFNIVIRDILKREDKIKNGNKSLTSFRQSLFFQEIRFFEYSDDGIPRFPVCVGLRLDK